MAQSDPCPGFHNPTNFNSYFGSTGSWSARVGDRVQGTTGSTGYNVLSTCARPNKTPIKGNANITSSDYYSGYCPHRCGSCNQCTLFDGHDQRFRIYTQTDAGLDQFTINNGQGMQRIPAGHFSSIRLGDMRATGQCVSNINSDGNNKGAEALFYTMNVPAPAITGALPTPWQEGLPGGAAGSTTCGYCYKPWTRVAISLINYIYDSVRVEMYTSDCIYNVDPIYAYIAGDCQPMQITASGCPAGSSNAVDTLRAPAGLLSYTWYVSSEGYSGNTGNTSYMNSLPFRLVQATSTNNTYVATTDDFIVTEGAQAGDTVGIQTFKCVMTSAMDPDKPFHSVVYATVSNTKPVVNAVLTPKCDSTVEMRAAGIVRYQGADAPHLVDSITRWDIYEGSTDDTPLLGSVFGKEASYKFSDQQAHAVKLTMYTEDSSCYTSQTYVVYPILPPDIHINIDKRTLCVGENPNVSEDATTPLGICRYHLRQRCHGGAPLY